MCSLLQLKDLKSSEIIEIYEHKVEAMAVSYNDGIGMQSYHILSKNLTFYKLLVKFTCDFSNPLRSLPFAQFLGTPSLKLLI